MLQGVVQVEIRKVSKVVAVPVIPSKAADATITSLGSPTGLSPGRHL